ncbi:hypothetical protein RI845_07555 [Thalassotalea nanhaiensis]|uniref:Sel1 repeat family protein n=1 Tax=Thalassotalea nanhaiensis TaxID=3065648 RepID=A0ABY9TN57_9GAMM|nr:hypothetical protein RI845_07555 [Colwelliaceae bacterium SQ345]
MHRLIHIIILSLCLTTSSFSLNSYLTERLSTGKYNQSQLQLALAIGNTSAKYIAFSERTPGSLPWLNLAKSLGRQDPEIAWQLALYYQQKSYSRETFYWQNHAFQLGAESAIIERAKQLSTTNEQYQQAKELLQAIDNEESYILQTRLAVKFSDFIHLQSLLPKLTSFNETKLLNELLAYQVLPSFSSEKAPFVKTVSASCRNNIQFFASNLTDLNRLDALIDKVKSNDFFNQQFCFNTPKYIALETLQCSHRHGDRINCDVELLIQQGLSNDVKYIGLMAPEGVANVNNGVLYIDQLDTHSVLEHELLHLIGFIDEYPLHKLNSACEQQGALAKNVVNFKRSIYSSDQAARAKVLPLLPWKDLIKPTTPISYKTAEGYRLGTPNEFSNDVGLFNSNTCKNYLAAGGDNQSFKPINKVSQLQYFEEPLPIVYQQLARLAGEQFNMPSYHYNIGKKYNQKDDVVQANYWFEKADRVEAAVKMNTLPFTKPKRVN